MEFNPWIKPSILQRRIWKLKCITFLSPVKQTLSVLLSLFVCSHFISYPTFLAGFCPAPCPHTIRHNQKEKEIKSPPNNTCSDDVGPLEHLGVPQRICSALPVSGSATYPHKYGEWVSTKQPFGLVVRLCSAFETEHHFFGHDFRC